MTKEKFIKQCECGENTFVVCEDYTYKAEIDPKTGTLQCYKIVESEIVNIECFFCGKGYSYGDFRDFSCESV